MPAPSMSPGEGTHLLLPCPFEIVGVIRSARLRAANTPVQSSLNQTEHGTVEFDPRYGEGLSDLAEFDYVWLLTWLDRPGEEEGSAPPLRQVPFLLRPTQRTIGLFAMRGPRRINPVGLSLVRVLEVGETTLRFAGVDLLDETPVIDVKPYVTRFDRPPGEPRCGWFDTVPTPEGITPSDLDR